MDCAISSGGLLIHTHKDWPCAICRPWHTTESRGFCICVKCAHRLIYAVEAGVEGSRALLADIVDAMVILEAHLLSRGSDVN
jgi:hypothetical protein